MTLTVRLDSELEDQLEGYCQAEGTTKSAVVTQALRQYLANLQEVRTPYDIYKDVMAENGLGDLLVADPAGLTDNSLHYKARLKDKLREKHDR